MKRFATILACTDLTEESFTAVEYAARLAKADGSRLTVLFVPQNSNPVFADLAPHAALLELDRKVESAARATLERWIVDHVDGSLRVRAVVRCGRTHEEILRTAADIGASLIVMATHGHRRLGALLVGSVTMRVLREAPCPVLAVRPPAVAARANRGKAGAAARKQAVKATKGKRRASPSPRA